MDAVEIAVNKSKELGNRNSSQSPTIDCLQSLCLSEKNNDVRFGLKRDWLAVRLGQKTKGCWKS